jgi:hypothetical protein
MFYSVISACYGFWQTPQANMDSTYVPLLVHAEIAAVLTIPARSGT